MGRLSTSTAAARISSAGDVVNTAASNSAIIIVLSASRRFVFLFVSRLNFPTGDPNPHAAGKRRRHSRLRVSRLDAQHRIGIDQPPAVTGIAAGGAGIDG